MENFELPLRPTASENPVAEANHETKRERAARILQKFGRRAFVALALASPFAAQSAEPLVKAPEASVESIPANLDSADAFMREKLDSLNIFNGSSFVKEVRVHTEALRAFLQNPEQPVTFPGLLGEIAERYAKPLAAAKESSPERYEATVKRFETALQIINTAKLTEIKEKLAEVFPGKA